MWTLWNQSKSFNRPPSELIDFPALEDPLLRYYFNNGVRAFGIHVENEMDKAARSAASSMKGQRKPNESIINRARTNKLAYWLGIANKVKYADPAGLAKKTEFSFQ